MNTSDRPGRPHVVVVGAGMAGLATVRALARAPVTVQLIDTHSHTTRSGRGSGHWPEERWPL